MATKAKAAGRKPRTQHYQNLGGAAASLDDENDGETDHRGPLEITTDPTAATVAIHEMSVDDAINRLGMGLFQYRILLAAGLCFAADAMEVLLLSFLSIVLQQEWGLSQDKTAFITSTLFAGALIGTSILGPLADAWGRRPVFLLAATMIAMFGVGTSMVNNYEQLLVVMFIIGFGVGGLTVPFDTLAEFLPSEGRGTNLLLIEYFWTIGCLLVIVFAELTLAHGKANWRLFVTVCALPCFVSIIIGWLYVPESVRWLISVGRNEEAVAILRDAARVNQLTTATRLTRSAIDSTTREHAGNGDHDNLHTGEEEDDVDLIFPLNTQLTSDEDHSSENSASCLDLLKPQWRGTILKLWGAWGGFGIAYYGSILSITKVFDEGGESAKNSTLSAFADTGNATSFAALSTEPPETTDFDYTAIFISSSAELLGTTFVILLVDRVGRIPTQVVSYSLAGICIFMMCTLTSSTGATSDRWELVGLGFMLRALDMAATCTSWVMTAEVLSTEIRTTGHSSANAMARLGAFFSPFLVDILPLKSLGLVMLIVHWFTAACVSLLPETKGMEMGGASGDGTGTLPDNNANAAARDDLSSSEDGGNEEPDALFVIDDDDDGMEFENGPIQSAGGPEIHEIRDFTDQTHAEGELT